MIKTYTELSQITSLLCYSISCNRGKVTGIKDTFEKISACYMAMRLTKYSLKEIANYFQIYPAYMEKRVEEFSIQLLVNPEDKEPIEDLERLYKELQNA